MFKKLAIQCVTFPTTMKLWICSKTKGQAYLIDDLRFETGSLALFFKEYPSDGGFSSSGFSPIVQTYVIDKTLVLLLRICYEFDVGGLSWNHGSIQAFSHAMRSRNCAITRTKMADPPPCKRAKIDDAKIDQVWEHFRNYVEEDSVDELQEMLSLLTSVSKASSGSRSLSFPIKSRHNLLPILWSTAYAAIAEESMSEYFAISSADSKNAMIPDREMVLTELREAIVTNVRLSLDYYAENPMPWSLASNFARTHGCANPSHTASWYLKAANCAQRLRAVAVECIDDSDTPEDLKEWLELLILNHVCGVEATEEDSWSSAAVESTSRFMAAMVLSTLDLHDKTSEQLSSFPSISHRIHPNVWRQSTANTLIASASNANIDPTDCPLSFASPILPPSLYKKLCTVFAPGASYWTESDYDARGYYSFYEDLPKDTKSFKPSNAIEETIIQHLLPRLQTNLGEKAASSIVGYEWWVHTRPVSASLGHNLHFDTDESKLAADGSITHPLVSSVLYLTAPPMSGPTIVFQQSPDATENAPFAWYSIPKDNSFMTFPGNLLHGVLPCMSADALDEIEILSTLDTLKESLIKACTETPPTDSLRHRLSFMVGFWTRRVPEEMTERGLYGPCGLLPDEAEWVKELQDGYVFGQSHEDPTEPTFVPTQLSCATPGWEVLPPRPQTAINTPGLEVPCAIDHRFFVADAPMCFRESLFEKDDEEEEDDLCVIDLGEDSSEEGEE